MVPASGKAQSKRAGLGWETDGEGVKRNMAAGGGT